MAFRACIAALGRGGSSRRSIRRCATGASRKSQRFDGFKLHAAATNSEEPLITAVEVGDASAHDGAEAKTLIDQQREESRPERILGDFAYGDQQTREDMQQRGVEVLAHVPEGELREGRVGKREFQIDLEAGTVTCPQGHVVAIPARAQARRARPARLVVTTHPPRTSGNPATTGHSFTQSRGTSS